MSIHIESHNQREEHTDYAKISLWQIIIEFFYSKYEIRMRIIWIPSSKFIISSNISSIRFHTILLYTCFNFLSIFPYCKFKFNIKHEPKPILSFSEYESFPSMSAQHIQAEGESFVIAQKLAPKHAFEYKKLNQSRNSDIPFVALLQFSIIFQFQMSSNLFDWSI